MDAGGVPAALTREGRRPHKGSDQTMKTQLLLSPPTTLSCTVPPVRNRWSAWNKPEGGLWTSTYRPETQDSAWVEWRSIYLSPPDHKAWWLLTPTPAARILTIDTLDDFIALLAVAAMRGSRCRTPDFERLSHDYDGLHLTEQGQRQTHSPYPYPDDLNGWDSECTLWFRWCFVTSERLR